MAIITRLGDAHKDWIAHLSEIKAKCQIFSPYVTSTTAEEVLQAVRSGAVELYTFFGVENFATGASSLATLKKLLDAGILVFHLPKLHAKIVWSDRRYLTIGSQNLTQRGTQQKEATVLFLKPDIPAGLKAIFEDWIKERRSITKSMISLLEKALPELRRKADLLKEEAQSIEVAIWQREMSLWETKVKRCRSRLRRLGSDHSVPLEVAERFVETSAYWIDHPWGICWSPGDANNIYGENPDWCIYEGNTFVVGRAILRCRKILKEFLADAADGGIIDFAALRGHLKDAICMSVTNSNGAEYSSFRVWKGAYDHRSNYLDVEYIKFGTHGIVLSEFVRSTCRKHP